MSTTDTTAPATKPRGTTTKFTVPAVALRDLVAGILPAVSKDEVTPILCVAQWIVEDGTLRLVATDRYRAHTAVMDLPGKPKAGTFTVPRSALVWIWKNANFYGRSRSNAALPVVEVELATPANADSKNPGTITVRVRSMADEQVHVLTFTDALVVGKFPPIYSLFEKARAAEFAVEPLNLRLDFLADARHLARDRYDTPKVKPTLSDSGKPGVVLVEFSEGRTGPVYAEAIVQPNLVLR